MKYNFLLFVIFLSFNGFSQNKDISMVSLDTKEAYITTNGAKVSEEDFIKRYELKGKKPIMAIVTSSFESHVEPNCGSDGTSIIIPKDSIVYLYKFLPKNNCWATNYKGNWGFLPNSKVFPISKRPQKHLNGSKFDTPPQLRTHISPKYPKIAKEAGINGKVFFKVFIDKKGRTKEVTIIEGPQELRQATIDAVEKAEFKPAELAGKKVGVWVTLSLNYN